MSFPRYPEYKDSGVEWLGEVPGHWGAVPIKHLGRLKGGSGFPHEKQGIEGEELSFHKVNALAQADSDGFLTDSENTIDRATAKELGAFVFPAGSIVFAKVGAALLLGRIRLLSQNACLDNNMMGLVVRQDEFAVSFVRYAMNLVRFDLIANPGAVPSLNEGQIGDFRLAMPPIPEQTQIAAFLDREIATIDALVAEQRRLMELLKEKRQTVISHAVTRGLNPDAPMKPSGIEWLGDVPEHWEVVQFKQLVDIQNGSDHKHVEQAEGYPVLGSGGIFTYASDFLYDGESVLLGRKGTIDKPLHIEGRFWTVDTMYWTKISSGVSGKFTYYLALTIPFDFYSTNTALPSMTKSALNSHRVAFPPRTEQIQIAAFLDGETSRIDTLTTEAQRAIDLLQERRTSLISAAVTGQIDVRHLVASPAH